MADILGIYTWMHTTVGGLTYRRYRCRGSGYTYDKFVEWAQSQKSMKVENDWPWFSWGFVDEASTQQLRLLWGKFLTDEEPCTATEMDSDEYEASLSPNDRFVEEELSRILHEEIMKEINKEFLAGIR